MKLQKFLLTSVSKKILNKLIVSAQATLLAFVNYEYETKKVRNKNFVSVICIHKK